VEEQNWSRRHGIAEGRIALFTAAPYELIVMADTRRVVFGPIRRFLPPPAIPREGMILERRGRH
jgi:hypothetical protein